MPRLFTGLEIPGHATERLSFYRGGLPGARWVEPSDYHVTLRFVGDVDGDVAGDLLAALGDGRRRGPVEVTLDALACFGGDRPRSVHARVRPTPALAELQAEHERAARQAGCPPERRRFQLHVTLARMRRAEAADVAGYLASHGVFAPIAFTAPRFVVYSSRDSVGGGPYVVEAAYPLGDSFGE